jgi:folate-binding protein YgfZ
MDPDWKRFLLDAGAEFGDPGVVSFGNPDLESRVATTGDVFCDLSHQGLIAARGADAAAFLHAQLSNDVAGLGPEASRLAAYCDPKGRMLAVLRIFRRDEAFYLRLPRTLVEPIIERLSKFVLRSRVTLADAGEALTGVGVNGPRAREHIAAILGEAPATVDTVLQRDAVTLIRVPGLHPRFEAYGPVDEMRRLWEALNVHAAPVGTPAWTLLEVLAGLPTVYPETVGRFVPQMANLQLVGGVSFRKGCYPGQEVVARMQYLGTLKRHMVLAHAQTDIPPRPGDPLHAPESGQGQDVGAVVDAAPAPDGGYLLLAVVRIASAASDTLPLRLWDENGPTLALQPLPYPFP